jgi:hypothetical protein
VTSEGGINPEDAKDFYRRFKLLEGYGIPPIRRIVMERCFRRLFANLGLATIALAGGKNLADYPLRVHVFGRNETTFYHMRAAEEAKGEGRANLFENGGARGMDFEFDCSGRLMASSGYETYAARWKKSNQQLEVLIPEFGKANSYSTCTFKVQMKDFAYLRRNGALNTEPISAFKDWMTKHNYDPEHGKNAPTQNTAPPSGPSTPGQSNATPDD